jgi:NifB/MoaA-like Fe-S oxidoreductase
MNRVEGLQINLLTVENTMLGSTVTVAGLLTGRDVRNSLIAFQNHGQPIGDLIFLPQVMLDKKGFGGRFLDDLTPADIAAAMQRPVVMAGYMSEVWGSISALFKTNHSKQIQPQLPVG